MIFKKINFFLKINLVGKKKVITFATRKRKRRTFIKRFIKLSFELSRLTKKILVRNSDLKIRN
jgi:hypothetical protein